MTPVTCPECRYDGGLHYTTPTGDEGPVVAVRCPEWVRAHCGVCGGSGWDTSVETDPKACTHAATRVAARVCVDHEVGGYCHRCPA